ncbi:MAG TPA: hypothetical protein VGN08_09055 [Solirubrobacteraceae bacterium]|jgi:predicted lipoprotein with Yx(FWY)xxD motif
MSRRAVYLLPTLAASLALAACGSSSSGSGGSATTGSSTSQTASSGSGGAGAVKTASNSALHATVLTTSGGATLYALSAETKGRFICTSAECVNVWHPVSAAGAGVTSGGVGSLTAVKRPDGSGQLAYKGMPLYTFSGDRAPGDAKGQGLKDVGTWSAVTVAATGTTSTHSAPASEPATSRSGGY